ncbi:amino acid/amide ABC transporter membrane protein 2, HAAT family [Natronoarchaeum philippinense]|uniref:Amino acid/amide ABC transporter membrane protein 2, HAAT family n=1 Tax=Natronoarchaeum philippinense TaxID=558529 RepID=A0A285NBK0_NATPI|nr:amino acid/amide ABC transporter membrane protein 2, HAAT family [Natronoarchaeum philippinense]
MLGDHAVHIAVVAAFALYPFVYAILTRTPVGAELAVLLPRIDTMVAVLYIGLFAVSFDFISGYTGYLSFGHGLFYGAGAYFVVLAATGKIPLLGAGTPFLLLLLIAGLFAVGVALLVGSVSFRLSGVYFAMITLGFAEVAHVFIRNWDYVGSNPRDGALIGGGEGFSIGVPGVDALQVEIGRIVGTSLGEFGPGIAVDATWVSYYAIGVVVLVSYFVLQRIVHSPFGRVMIAIRENEERARAVGYDVFRIKLVAFAISGFFAAIAGALFAGYRRSVSPENTFDLFVTADALLASIIGGFGTLAGPLYGYLFKASTEGVLSTEYYGVARYLRRALPESTLSSGVGGVTVADVIRIFVDGRADLYLGIVFILFVLYVPRGILGTLRDRLGGTVAERLPERLRSRIRGWQR